MTDQLFDHLQATLGDSYRLERELGGGGMGRVFVAEETTLERKVVVKVLPPEMGRSMSADRFRREIQLAAKLQHPHIVPLLAAGATPEGMLYYTMPYIEGDSLRRRLTRAGELPIPEALRILRQVVDALAYAHARGVVHRDIKPDNILIHGNHALVTDFGVSKALSTATGPTSLTSIGVALGTPAYMSPEQAAADPNTDHRADIYAIGILAYELLTGHPPFQGSSPQQVLAAHATVPAPRIIPLRASVPQPVEDLVMLCLEKHAADRPQTADEVLQRLESLSTPSYGSTPVPMQPTQPRKARRRFPIGKAVAVGAAAGVIALAALGASLFSRDADSTALVDKRVLFAGFENKSGDASLDVMGVMATDWLARIATNEGGLEVASPEGEIAVGSDGAIIKSARSENARAAIHGSYYRMGDSVQFQLAILDAAENRVWRTLGPFSVAAASPGPGLDAMAKRVAGALAYMFQGFLGRDLATTLPNLDAAREYLRADMEYRASLGNSAGARDRAVSGFLATYALDPAFTWALVRAAHIGSLTNDCRLTDSLGTVLAPARARMGAPEGAYLERVIAWCRGDWGAAYAAAQRLRRAAPRSDEAKSIVGYSALSVGRARESANAFAGMARPFQAMVQYQYYSDALHLLGDTRAERELGREIQLRFPEEFRGFLAEARSSIVTGKHDQALRILDRGIGTRGGTSVPADLRSAGAEFEYHGHADFARQLYLREVEWYESLPSSEHTPAQRRWHVRSLVAAGRGAEALTLARSIAGSPEDSLGAIAVLGIAAASAGNRTLADSVDRVLDRLNESSSGDTVADGSQRPGPTRRGDYSFARAQIAAAAGDTARTASLLRRALGEGYRPSVISYHLIPEFAKFRGQGPFASLIRLIE